jgi:hypothetical protein
VATEPTRTVQIPRSHVIGLRYLAELSDEKFEKLLHVVSALKPQYSPSELVKQLATAAPDSERVRIACLSEMLLDLAASMQADDGTVDALIRTVTDLLPRVDEIASTMKQQPEILPSRLRKLLTLPVFDVAVKAGEVLYDHGRVFSEARILTDVRPVFGKVLDDGPIVAGVVHNLKLVYKEDFQTREFFVTLDDEDLAQLRDVVERALQKQKILKQTIGPVIPLCNTTPSESV